LAEKGGEIKGVGERGFHQGTKLRRPWSGRDNVQMFWSEFSNIAMLFKERKGNIQWETGELLLSGTGKKGKLALPDQTVSLQVT